jgi:hypothetical protein
VRRTQVEKFPGEKEDDPPRLGKDLPAGERKALLTERIKGYAQRVYKRVTSKPVTDTRIAGVCQRENGFYIDTVRSFRDRRYEYKGLVKRWKGALGKALEAVRHPGALLCSCLGLQRAGARSGWGKALSSLSSTAPQVLMAVWHSNATVRTRRRTRPRCSRRRT